MPRLTDGQIVAGLAQMVAMLHDDETLVMFPQRPVVPLDAQWVGGGLYLLAAPAGDQGLLRSLGCRSRPRSRCRRCPHANQALSPGPAPVEHGLRPAAPTSPSTNPAQASALTSQFRLERSHFLMAMDSWPARALAAHPAGHQQSALWYLIAAFRVLVVLQFRSRQTLMPLIMFGLSLYVGS